MEVYTLFNLQNVLGKDIVSLCLDLTNEPFACLKTNYSIYRPIDRRQFMECIANNIPGFDPDFQIPYSYNFRLFYIKTYQGRFVDFITIDLRSGEPYRCISWVWGKGSCCETVYIPISFDEVRQLAPESSEYKNIDESNCKTFLPPSGTVW